VSDAPEGDLDVKTEDRNARIRLPDCAEVVRQVVIPEQVSKRGGGAVNLGTLTSDNSAPANEVK
jgi:hypothetical protein